MAIPRAFNQSGTDMGKGKSTGRKINDHAKSFGRIIIDDIRHGDLPNSWLQDFKDIYHFYVDRQTKERFARMGPVKRAFYVAFWLLKSLFLKLVPARRILLIAGLVLLFGIVGGQSQFNNWNICGILVILTVLMLELKDKLMAKDELAVGRKVQTALLPTEHPHLDGWEIWLYTRPANEVGGDLVDFLELDDRGLCLFLGDVAGKGLGAALLMAKLQATLRALAPDEPRLEKLGQRVNRILCRDGVKERFATLVYLEIEPDSGRVRLLNAGHMPPLHLKGNKISTLAKGGPALGLSRQVTYKPEHIDLAKDDWLLVYTDGLTEARDAHDAFFGEDRLMALLARERWTSAEKLGRSLVDAVDRFAGTARPSDDLSLILIHRIA